MLFGATISSTWLTDKQRRVLFLLKSHSSVSIKLKHENIYSYLPHTERKRTKWRRIFSVFLHDFSFPLMKRIDLHFVLGHFELLNWDWKNKTEKSLGKRREEKATKKNLQNSFFVAMSNFSIFESETRDKKKAQS